MENANSEMIVILTKFPWIDFRGFWICFSIQPIQLIVKKLAWHFFSPQNVNFTRLWSKEVDVSGSTRSPECYKLRLEGARARTNVPLETRVMMQDIPYNDKYQSFHDFLLSKNIRHFYVFPRFWGGPTPLILPKWKVGGSGPPRLFIWAKLGGSDPPKIWKIRKSALYSWIAGNHERIAIGIYHCMGYPASWS